jgi:hypothetical protein
VAGARRGGHPRRSPVVPPRRTASRSSPPARLESLPSKTAQELTDALTVRRRHPGTADFTRLGVQPVGRDLHSMLVESHYDRHPGPPHAPRSITGTPCAPELRRSLHARGQKPAHAIFRLTRRTGRAEPNAPCRPCWVEVDARTDRPHSDRTTGTSLGAACAPLGGAAAITLLG